MGGTGTRGALLDIEGNELGRAQTGAGALSLGAPRSFEAIQGIWSKVCGAVGRNPKETKTVHIALGIAGYGLKERRDQLYQLLGDFAGITIGGDGYGALIGATKGAPGALISVGTGVGALRLDANGKTLGVSSWGFPAGDAGGGAWLGLRLFGDFINALDQIPSDRAIPETLIAKVLKITGPGTQDIMGWQRAARPGDFGRLAPLIVEGAKGGDDYCRHLLAHAARQICRVAQVLRTPDSNMIYISGGLGKILLPHCQKSAPDIDWRLSMADPVFGMFLLASGQAPEMQLLTRPGLIPRLN